MAEEAYQPAGILSPQIFNLPVDRDILFSNHKDVYKNRIEKRQRHLFVKIVPIKPFLRRNEKILLVTRGYAPLASLGQLLTGFVFSFLKRSLFVFTNQRIIHLPTSPMYKYKHSLAQIEYDGCRSIGLNGGTLVVRYAKSGRIEKFRAIALRERKKIRALFKKRIPLSGTRSLLADRTHLCPRCASKLTREKNGCPKCRLKFKSGIGAALLAILLPGGGYFYVRHYLIGFLAGLLEISLLAYSFFLFWKFNNQMAVDMTYLTVIPLVFLYVKISAVIHSTQFTADFIPSQRKIKPRKAS